MVATAGVTAAPRRVAAKTLRTGLSGCKGADADVIAQRRECQLGDQRHPDPRSHQALHRLVVVALEGDAGLKARRVAGADDVPGAGAGRGGLDPGLVAEVLEPQPVASRERMVTAKRQVERIVEQLEAPHPGAEPLARCLELEEHDEVELAGPQARGDLLGLALGEGHANPRMGGAEAGDRQRHQRRPRGGEGGDSKLAGSAAGDLGDLGLGRLHPSQYPLGAIGQRRAGGGGTNAATVALDQRHAQLPLQRRDRLRDRRLRVGERVGGAGKGASRHRPLARRSAGQN